MMFKNRRVLLSSVAIVLTLIVSAIFVNFTLANSGSVAEETASLSSTTGLTGYSNIDLAVINSNDTSLQATGDDKYRIVQILPASMQDYADADTKLTATVTASGYSGTVSTETGYTDTTDLWKYVYDGEYFRYAVFDGYKTISNMSMAEGAVQLTTVTVADLNDMESDAQEILNSADMIYICAMSYTDYITTDISEDLYNWLVTYATTDNYPLIIDYDTLCIDDPAGITGNNDTYRMGTLAYKLMTKTCVARYDNVLVTGPVFGDDGAYHTYFYTLYVEASGNIDTQGQTSTTKTISDFILRAEELGYVESNPYYNKWYGDESFSTFANQQSVHGDSAYGKVTAGTTSGLTGSKTEWDYDNAKILVITNGESNSMYYELIDGNDKSGYPTENSYTYSESTGIWSSVAKARNSDVTTGLYYTNNDNYAFVPSGAEIYRLQSSNLLSAITGTGSIYDYHPSDTGYLDVSTAAITANITVDSSTALEGASILLFAKNSDGVYEYLSTDGTTLISYDLGTPDDNGDGTYTYTINIEKLNADYTDYKLFLVLNDTVLAGNALQDTDGDGTNEFVWEVGTATSTSGYTTTYGYYIVTDTSSLNGNSGTGVITDLPTDYDFKTDASNPFIFGTNVLFDDDTYIDTNDYIDAAAGYYFLDSAATVISYVKEQYSAYCDEILAESMTGSTFSFTDFDFIFIEDGDYADEIGNEVYNQLLAAVDAGVYVIVGDEAGSGIASSTDGSGSGVTITINSPSAQAIADIINAGVYRDGADNKFKVLEIQPDYPIDTKVAENNGTYSGMFTYHSDGTAITGDYYTVPSDVVSGNAKEELDEGTEYYEFDLTKAKIAYAIDGVSYSQIELTQVSTEALIGMTEDIAATYDLVYIGGDISAVDRDVDGQFNKYTSLQGIGGYFASMMPVFIMYTHTGSIAELSAVMPDGASVSASTMLATPVINGTTYASTAYTVQNGNDLTYTKYEELLNYINSGRPVIVSDELTSVYEKMNAVELSETQLLMGYWYDNGVLERGNVYLDPTSRIYKLVDSIYATYQKSGTTNIIWGFDASDTQKVENEDGKYGTTLYTARYANTTSEKIYLTSNAQKESWYTNETNVVKSYATVFSDTLNAKLNSLVNDNTQRVRLTVTTKPTAYKEGVESTYISYTNLSYAFILNGKTGTYTYNLYVDKDKNTSFDTSSDYYTTGTVKVTSANNDTETSVNLALDSDFYGAAYWLLQIEDADGNVVAEETGISKIVNTVDGTSEINVLQVQTMVDGQDATTWTATDTLYFDIMSQTSHKICLYNTYANMTDLDNVKAIQYACLGRHENRFGIVEYDTSKGSDDYYSNLADAITDDYNVNLDIIVADEDYTDFETGDGVKSSYDCLDTWVSEAETLESGGTVENMTKATYKSLVSNAQTTYNAKMTVTEKKKEAIDEFLQAAIDYLDGKYTSGKYLATFQSNTQSSGFFVGFNSSMSNDDIKELLQWMMDTSEYSQIFFAGYTTNTNVMFSSGEVTDTMFGPTFTDLFIEYRDAKDDELKAKDTYRTYLRRSYGSDFMKKMYSILILGPSECFGGFAVDVSADTCSYILDFVSNGGDLFFFHDTMTPYADAGAVTLTKSLLDVVGMNRFHVDFTDQANTYDVNTYTLNTYTSVDASAASVTSTATSDTYTDLTYKAYNDDDTLYYMTPLTFSSGLGIINSINYGLKLGATTWRNQLGTSNTIYISALSMTYLYQDGNSNGATYTLPYIYTQMGYKKVTSWSKNTNADQSATSQTVKASQLNEGLVTLYPFQIGDSLNISGTHEQAYALDLESDKVTVWYTLAGSNNSSDAKIRSSMFAADPYDAMENYFIYTTYYGSGAITYCGAGHSSVTGKTTKNNDERKLFINVIVNSAEAVAEKPSIKIYEPDGTYETELDKDEEMTASTGRTVYLIEADSKTDTPEFDVKVTIPDGTTVTSVRFYYDGDYTGTGRPGYIDDTYHAEIYYEEFADGVTVNWTKMMREATDLAALNLKEEYFSWYGGTYTYLVVEVYYDGSTKPVYAIIKIKASDPLFDLTENDTTIQISAVDAVAEKVYTLA